MYDDKQLLIQRWLEYSCQGKSWYEYLVSYGYQKYAIYGAGDLGRYLAMELDRSAIKIQCFIDRRAHEINSFMNHDVLTLEEFLEKDHTTDAIIVSVSAANEEVLNQVMRVRPSLPVMSLRDMLYEM